MLDEATRQRIMIQQEGAILAMTGVDSQHIETRRFQIEEICRAIWMTQDEVRSLDELNPMGGDAAQLPKPTNVPQPQPSKDDPDA